MGWTRLSSPLTSHNSIHVSLPDPSEIGFLGPNPLSTRQPSQDYTTAPTPTVPACPGVPLCCLPTPIPFCIQLLPQTPQTGVGGWGQAASSSPLLTSLWVPAPALTDPSLALSMARAARRRQCAVRSRPGGPGAAPPPPKALGRR